LVNYVSIVDLININEIENDCDNEDIQEHNDVSIGINEVGSIPFAFDSNFAPMALKNLMSIFNQSVVVLEKVWSFQ
jgi:hypothetical protein